MCHACAQVQQQQQQLLSPRPGAGNGPLPTALALEPRARSWHGSASGSARYGDGRLCTPEAFCCSALLCLVIALWLPPPPPTPPGVPAPALRCAALASNLIQQLHEQREDAHRLAAQREEQQLQLQLGRLQVCGVM